MIKHEKYKKNGKLYEIEYQWHEVENVLNNNGFFDFAKYTKHGRQYKSMIKSYQVKKGKYPQFIDMLPCSFDIETTRLDKDRAYMYCWQFGILFKNKNIVIVGDTWEQFIKLLDKLCEVMARENHNLIIGVANLGYEWQFMKHHLTVTNCFFKEEREPVEIEHNNYILFKECLSWGGSLKKLAQDYTELVKLKGDLDYTKHRETYKEHTRREQRYCDFDVLILCQFLKWFENQYLKRGQFPKTTTGANRLNMRECCEDVEQAERIIKNAYPQTRQDYDTLLNWVYRGGFTHGNMYFIGEIIKHVYSVDFTSSYPSVMLYELYPWKFSKVNANNYSIDLIIEMSDKFAFYGAFKFTNIRSITQHSIESVSKCVNGKEIMKDANGIIDNGRVRSCSEMVVYLTEQDIQTYKEFYTWDNVQCQDLHISRKKPLPKYLLKVLCDSYTKKAFLKEHGENYAIEKTYVNANYGMTVTRQVLENVYWNSELEQMQTEPNDKAENYEKFKERQLLLPQFGVWVSAYARRNLLRNVYALEHENKGVNVLYCDTDSIKYIGEDKAQVIKRYNDEIARKRDKMLNDLQDFELEKEYYFDLGMFDNETSGTDNACYDTFKMLGAKRYLYTYKKHGVIHYNCTVAGLPKQEYYKHYAQSLTRFYANFNDSLCVEKCKLTSNYIDNDKSFEIIRNGKREIIQSCLVLNDSDFSMSIEPNWYMLVLSAKNKGKEFRNYG